MASDTSMLSYMHHFIKFTELVWLSLIQSLFFRVILLTRKVWERIHKIAISKQLQLKQYVRKIWELRSHAFPPHYTPAFLDSRLLAYTYSNIYKCTHILYQSYRSNISSRIIFLDIYSLLQSFRSC